MNKETLELLKTMGIDVGPIEKIIEAKERLSKAKDNIDKINILHELGIIDDKTYRTIIKYYHLAKAFKPKK